MDPYEIKTISIQEFEDGKQGIAAVNLIQWDHYEWIPQPDGKFLQGKLLGRYNCVRFAVERNASRRIRLVKGSESVPELFPIECQNFMPEKDPAVIHTPSGKPLPYGGLGIFGAMLRRMHYEKRACAIRPRLTAENASKKFMEGMAALRNQEASLIS